MKLTDEQVTQNLDQFLETFRPQFGNQRHIDIAEQHGKVSKIQLQINKRQNLKPANDKRMLDELNNEKRLLLGMFKNMELKELSKK